ncbi:hypothetical protein POM88_008176 [Heracleum sosnowskyi]|uniref:RNase H type-1 domain-containing protein n=1 Tax=Heracleum sosnowskyi TaxID=360622 RepID=A0AAD8N889_9APIA|nr:hypothetical protein POM88_049365 [Heracleum sosnowskyi]KAK1361050.1 hypothetical protein POM88_045524 [Heracleum sosnowskyi]KAK1361731.1 hypothetical protein POM88_046205 [Heracleum sosnowskyi]KAK1363108.1 hypothetical protein POM88_038669 [Heracleum sosnowskyi]KAK1366028.1 hypothetical protein POM88_041589 [Heracleum sosnowskyi]
MENVENVNVNVRWEMPPKGLIKINVAGFFSEQPLENGNVSGIGVVFRNSRGSILRMYAGSLQKMDRRINELFAMLEGMKRAFYANFPDYILETQHVDAFWEWRHSSIEGATPDHASIVQQLNQRKGDKNFWSNVRLADPQDNVLAMYLAEFGAAHWTTIVQIKKPFGRVHELWNLDMGLGPVDPQFLAVREEDLLPEVVEPEFEPIVAIAGFEEELDENEMLVEQVQAGVEDDDAIAAVMGV